MLEEIKIKDVRRILGIDNAWIAKKFGYASQKAYENSSAKKRIERGIIEVFKKSDEYYMQSG